MLVLNALATFPGTKHNGLGVTTSEMLPESSSFVGDRMRDVMGESERLRKRRQQVQAEVTALEGQVDELQEQLRLLRNRLKGMDDTTIGH